MKSTTRQTIQIFWQHSQKYRGFFWLIIFSILSASALQICKPFLYKNFFNILAASNPEISLLISILINVLLLSFGYWIFWRIATFTNTFFQARIMADLMNTCFAYLHNHSYGFFSNNFTGSLVRRVNKYSWAFEQITDQFFWALLPTATSITMICIILFFEAKILGLVLFFWSAFYIIFIYFFSLYKLKFDIKRTEMDTQASAVLSDTISNNINLKMFIGNRAEEKNFKNITQGWFKAATFTWNLSNILEALQGGLMILLEFAVFYLAIKFKKQGNLTVGDFVLIQAYLIYIFDQLWGLGRNIRRIYESLADAEEMTRILHTPHEIQDKPGAIEIKVIEGKIEFNDVGFNYHKPQTIFKHLNLDIAPGERIALIGPSGGGKTTVVRLLLRFFDIQEGEILIDGQNISQVSQNSLRQNISLVPQEPILFHRSLLENIRYAKPEAKDVEVIAAAKLAHAHEFISKTPQGYNTFVGERGIKLSGGERQRVAIARAILKNAPILVLDEATSSLDSESEMLIQDALKNLIKNKTTIVIAHRLSTIMQMDRILVLENGKITEQGKHEELLKIKQGTYLKLWGIQAGGFA